MAIFQINNFSGNLTRKVTGQMNSGLARVGKTYSIDPFNNAPGLIFQETPTNLDPTHATITDIIVDGVLNEESGVSYLYCIDRSGIVYKINTSSDATAVVTNALGITLKYGGGIKILATVGVGNASSAATGSYLIIAHDGGVLYMDLDGTGVTTIQNFTVQGVTDIQVNTTNDTLTIPNSIISTLHTGDQVVLFSGSTPPPAPLVYGTTYYFVPFDNTHIRLATTQANALAGVYIDITTTGVASGTFNFQFQNWISGVPHPISDEFFGGFFIGNGPYLADFNSNSLTLNSSRLSPTFPKNYVINSLTVDGEGRYLRINGTTGTTQDIITTDPSAPTQAPISRTIYWNGIDETYDSYDPFTQTNMSSMFSFLGNDIGFGQDFWGASMFQTQSGSVDKMLDIKEIRAPNYGSITSTGSLLLFAAPYYVQNAWKCGIFSFGTLDDQDQPGIYSLLGIAPSDSNTICTAVGMLRLVQNRYRKSDGTYSTNSKFYVSTYETGTTPHANFYSFSLTSGQGTASAGVYETQIEEFTMMQQIDRVAFYIKPSTTGVSFKLDLIDVDSSVPSGASFTYTYAAGTDETLLQGSLEFFEWANLQIKNMQALGLRITNLGTAQPGLVQLFIETHDTDKGASQLQQT